MNVQKSSAVSGRSVYLLAISALLYQNCLRTSVIRLAADKWPSTLMCVNEKVCNSWALLWIEEEVGRGDMSMMF